MTVASVCGMMPNDGFHYVILKGYPHVFHLFGRFNEVIDQRRFPELPHTLVTSLRFGADCRRWHMAGKGVKGGACDMYGLGSIVEAIIGY